MNVIDRFKQLKINWNVCWTTKLFNLFFFSSFTPSLFPKIGMIVSATLVSVLSVLLVAIDRFFYILYGLHYQRYIFPNRARILIMTTWIIGELLAVLNCAVFKWLRNAIFFDTSQEIKVNDDFYCYFQVAMVKVLIFRLLCNSHVSPKNHLSWLNLHGVALQYQ